MKRATRWLALAALALALTSIPVRDASAQTRYWRAGFTFNAEPRMNFIPNTSIYYDRRASGYDMYRYGNRYYLVDQGSWYWANDWRGDSLGGWKTQAWAPLVILEGVTCTRLEAASRLACSIWVEAPEDLRLQRGLERDGTDHRQLWLTWMAEEREFFGADRTRARADHR